MTARGGEFISQDILYLTCENMDKNTGFNTKCNSCRSIGPIFID